MAASGHPKVGEDGEGTDVSPDSSTDARADEAFRLRPGGDLSGYDPWVEIVEDAFRHNVAEVARLAGGRPVLAVIKNNAYGMGDSVVGPIVASCPEVRGIACVRAHEAIALREAGVEKPILNMAEVAEEETVELMRHGVASTVWLDDAPQRMARVAERMGRPVPVHLFLDTGMGREGMPDHRAGPWIEALVRSPATRVRGTYTMFAHEPDFNPVQLERFLRVTGAAREAGLALGALHAAPSYEILYLPEAHLDMVRPGNLLFGNYTERPELERTPELRTVYRLRARISRLERFRPGDSASFGRNYVAERPTWIALVPVGHTDGYPPDAPDRCQVLIRDRLYPVVGWVSSTHAVIEIGEERSVEVGDPVTLIGPDRPEIEPREVAERTGLSHYRLMVRLSPFLPRLVV